MLIPVVWWLNALFTATWICTNVSWTCSIVCLPLDALTRVGVTLSLLCCQRVAIFFRLAIGVQLLYSNLHTKFCKTGLQTIGANIGEASVQRSSWIPTMHKCRGCLCGIGTCLQQVFGMEFPCLVCKLRFEESI